MKTTPLQIETAARYDFVRNTELIEFSSDYIATNKETEHVLYHEDDRFLIMSENECDIEDCNDLTFSEPGEGLEEFLRRFTTGTGYVKPPEAVPMSAYQWAKVKYGPNSIVEELPLADLDEYANYFHQFKSENP